MPALHLVTNMHIIQILGYIGFEPGRPDSESLVARCPIRIREETLGVGNFFSCI